MSLRGPPHHAPSIALATGVARPVDELRADAPQQQAKHRRARRFLLYHERETRRQRGLHHDSVEIARVVGDDHA